MIVLPRQNKKKKNKFERAVYNDCIYGERMKCHRFHGFILVFLGEKIYSFWNFICGRQSHQNEGSEKFHCRPKLIAIN